MLCRLLYAISENGSLYRMNYWIHGLHSYGYHLANIILYVFVVISVYFLGTLLFENWAGEHVGWGICDKLCLRVYL